jgi:hypothetical protein
MNVRFIFVVVAMAATVTVAPIANAAKPAAHKAMHHHAKGGCKGEFMYMKGGKCLDARAKA